MSAQVLILDASDVGARIRSRRIELGITQAQLRIRADVSSDATLSYIENGRNLPGLDLAVRIGRVLGVSVDWLCGLASAGAVSSSPAHSDGTATAHVLGGGEAGPARVLAEQTGPVRGTGSTREDATAPTSPPASSRLLALERDTAPGLHHRELVNSSAP